MDATLGAFFTTALITIAALLPITNPPGNAPIFLSLTRELTDADRDRVAGRVAFFCLGMLVVGMFAGTHILGFFDISLPVVRVAGGLLVAATAWRLLTAESGAEGDAPRASRYRNPADIAGHAFYPLSFPLTVGPGSISIAITLGAALPSRGVPALVTAAGSIAGLVAVSLAIFLAYRFAPRLVRLLGETGTAVFLRLSAFILLCIGVQICWEGLNELLAPWKPVR